MSCKEMQEEEFEVLTSIYDGDPNYKQISPSCFQYKIGIDGDPKSFLLEISWAEQYPNVPPEINLNAFYNNNIILDVKNIIISKLLEEADSQLGMPMTYTLIEWAKDNAEELTKFQPEKQVFMETSPTDEKSVKEDIVPAKKEKEKKLQLTKHQKRRLAEKLDAKGEHARGWDWVDVVKHLSQMGPRQVDDPPPS